MLVALVIAGLFVGAVIYGNLMYSRGARVEGLRQSIALLASTVELYNETLRSWIAYAATERIEGTPLRIEMQWNEQMDWLRSMTIVIRDGFKDLRYEVVLKDQIARSPGGTFTIVGALDFQPKFD